MTVTIPIRAIELTPGSMISIHNLSWQDFEQILTELGEKRSTRIAYYQGTLEIMSPLALHERPHRIIGDIVKAILDAQGRDWEDFGSTTLKQPEIAGVEPDTCFYIQNASRVRGCTNMDLAVYPPPDLAIESDVTSKTTLNAYEALRVPEVWIYQNRQLKIYILQNGGYVESSISAIFPDLAITEMIPQLVQKAIEDGTSRMLRELKIQLSQ
ncbi:Uma2 family endonuclease [Coleofasciculus sp. FACHB-T130]|uniref:Uma2 family endonuclease n=1 Tax=Cyanophyceae TaxID=3028117 RepID=UPI0016837D61|nr:Uma2 family endonuclease [Coleofasciculus sp. FACHB-T130]MBD1879053.1 Uma2 family endonuclease [Coleofasciculus sp. FACHB-T130]